MDQSEMLPKGYVKQKREENKQRVLSQNNEKKAANWFEQSMLFKQKLNKKIMTTNQSEIERLDKIVNQFDPNDVETERFRMQKILKSIAKLGSVTWEELHQDAIYGSCTNDEILRHFNRFDVGDLMEFAIKRKFIFFNFDRQNSPEVRDYTYFLIISSMFRYCCMKDENFRLALLMRKFSSLSKCDAMEDVPESFSQIINSNRDLFELKICDSPFDYVDDDGERFKSNLYYENVSENDESSEDEEEMRRGLKYYTQITPIIDKNVIAFFFDDIVIDLTRSDDKKLNTEGKSRIETVQGTVSYIGPNVRIMSNMDVHSDFGYAFVNPRVISKHVGKIENIVKNEIYLEGYRCNDALKKLKWMAADSFFEMAKKKSAIELEWYKDKEAEKDGK